MSSCFPSNIRFRLRKFRWFDSPATVHQSIVAEFPSCCRRLLGKIFETHAETYKRRCRTIVHEFSFSKRSPWGTMRYPVRISPPNRFQWHSSQKLSHHRQLKLELLSLGWWLCTLVSSVHHHRDWRFWEENEMVNGIVLFIFFCCSKKYFQWMFKYLKLLFWGANVKLLIYTQLCVIKKIKKKVNVFFHISMYIKTSMTSTSTSRMNIFDFHRFLYDES